MEMRLAHPGEWPEVMAVLDAGLLETDPARVRDAISAGDVLVAVEGERVLGVLLLDPPSGVPPSRGPARGDWAVVEAVAVRRRRRGQGLGSALVEAAADRHRRLVAGFDGRTRSFWEGLGFEVRPVDGCDRYVGTYDLGRDG